MQKRKRQKPALAAYILAIDQGTTGTKAVVLRSDLKVLAEATRELPQHFPRPGWVEHDLEEIYTSVRGAVVDALRKAKVPGSKLTAIGITNQRETTALWDRKSGRPIHRAIVWQDRRTADHCAELRRQGLEPLFRKQTGLVLDPYFSGTKIAWILDRVPGARRRAENGALLFGTIDTYLLWRLTGRASHATDISNASRTLAFDLTRNDWGDELLEALHVPRAVLPRVLANDAVFGHTKGADFLPDGIPIASVIGDQQSALFGQACFAPGEAKCTYGTGAFLVLNTGTNIVRSRSGLLSTAAWKLGRRATYALEGSTFVAGAIVQWLRDGLQIVRSAAEIETLARQVPGSDGVVLVPALTGLGAPHWDPDARGLLCGLTRGTTRAHIARAALEGIAMQIHDLVRAMENDLGRRVRTLKVDGGASLNALLMQFQADILGTRVVRPAITSTTALGTALLAGLTTGIFTSLPQIAAAWSQAAVFQPRIKPAEARRRVAEWTRAVERTKS